MADDKDILSDVQRTLGDHEFGSYEALHSAVESKRVLRELQGMKRSRRLTMLAAVTAFLSSGAALGGFIFLVLQSDINQSFNQRDTLQMRVENLNDDIDDLGKEKGNLSTAVKSLKSERNSSQTKAEQLRKTISELNNELSELRTQVSEAKAARKSIEAKITQLGVRPSVPGRDLEADLRSTTSQKLALEARMQTTQTEISRLNQQLLDAQEALGQSELSSANLSSKVSELESIRDVAGFAGSVESELISRDTRIELVTRGEVPTTYGITLTNVGNIEDNIDLEIVVKGSDASTNLVNLRKGQRYAAAFDDKLFLINVIEAIRSKRKQDEQGQFSLVLLDGEHKLVY